MAITIDWPTGVITIPQADLTLISGTLYELDTDAFRLVLKDLEDDEDGMAWPATHRHNTTVTISGTTFVRSIEIINGYSITFSPDSQYSVRMDGASNNNFHDVEAAILNQNQVQIIAQNSAGNTITATGISGLTAAESAQLQRIDDGVFGQKILQVSLNPASLPGFLVLYDDAATPVVLGHKELWADEAKTIGWADTTSIFFEGALIAGPPP